MEYILELHNVIKKYPGFELKNINLKVPYGKVVGLIGENGSGKTTMINLILNQIKRDSGNIQVFGKDNIKDELEIKKRVGFFVDECCYHPCLNPKNINGIARHIYNDWNSELYYDTLKKLNVDSEKHISDMSKGMKSKLMLSTALSHEPSLLILDEVTSGLDPVVRASILSLLQDYAKKNHASVFFSTHITEDLEKITDDIIFLHKGRQVFYKSYLDLNKEYLLLKCSKQELKKINPLNIVKKCYSNDEYSLLLKNGVYTDIKGKFYSPRIDDIMLMYIKGECEDVRPN
ncbi:ABC transporter ATP-binding protein [Hungatella sp.]|uniref:ABC transporter ATP-binding protein n=1 Tax=Hungatella sp. TaxID=2613924 RepID=UPI002A80347C|nr:ABC transporter ATP-binding protein [Hungatella sp.]